MPIWLMNIAAKAVQGVLVLWVGIYGLVCLYCAWRNRKH